MCSELTRISARPPGILADGEFAPVTGLSTVSPRANQTRTLRTPLRGDVGLCPIVAGEEGPVESFKSVALRVYILPSNDS